MNFVNYMKIKILNRLILHKDMFKSINDKAKKIEENNNNMEIEENTN